MDVEDAAGVAELELLLAVDAYAEEAGERVNGDAAERRAAHGGVEEGAVALDEAEAVFDLFHLHERIVLDVETLEGLDLLLQRHVAPGTFADCAALLVDAAEHAQDRVRAQFVGHGVDDGDAERVVLFRKEMIARLGETVTGGGPARRDPLRVAGDLRLDPPFALELQKLLANAFTGQSELIGEMRDRGRSATLQRVQNGAPAVR